MKDGDKLVQQGFSNKKGQEFKINTNPDNSYSLDIPYNSKCIDLAEGATKEGAFIVQVNYIYLLFLL